MACINVKLTIIFEKPFWYGIYEKEFKNYYEICKIVFGSEPKDYEVYEYLLENSKKLEFYKKQRFDSINLKHKNPKRLQREVKKQTLNVGIGTKAQEALKLQYEEIKKEVKYKRKVDKEREKDFKFILKQEKKKAKHKGH